MHAIGMLAKVFFRKLLPPPPPNVKCKMVHPLTIDFPTHIADLWETKSNCGQASLVNKWLALGKEEVNNTLQYSVKMLCVFAERLVGFDVKSFQLSY